MDAVRRLRAHHGWSGGMNQRSRAQFRAKSGAPAAIKGSAETAEWEFAAWAGKAQVKTSGAMKESVFWPCGGGTVGVGCESGVGLAAQQGIVSPCEQQAWARGAQGDTV